MYWGVVIFVRSLRDDFFRLFNLFLTTQYDVNRLDFYTYFEGGWNFSHLWRGWYICFGQWERGGGRGLGFRCYYNFQMPPLPVLNGCSLRYNNTALRVPISNIQIAYYKEGYSLYLQGGWQNKPKVWFTHILEATFNVPPCSYVFIIFENDILLWMTAHHVTLMPIIWTRIIGIPPNSSMFQ